MNNRGENLNKIANALLLDYVDVYYINAVTNEYEWFSIQKDTRTLKHERDGKDFFEDVIRDADKVIHEDDKHIFFNDIQKKNLLENLQKGEMKSIVYRHVKDGKNVWHSLRLIRGLEENDDYFIIGVLNIDEEVRKQREQDKLRKEAMTYNDIATQLAERYDTIYYVDLETDYYVEISSTDMYRAMNVPVEGKDFFEESVSNAMRIIHKQDQQIFIEHCIKDKILEKLEKDSTVQFDYRIIYEESVVYARLSIMMTKDKKHLLYCVENIDDQVRALKTAKEKAIRDELTGVRNKNAFQDYESDLQKRVNAEEIDEFAIVMCDLNDLKKINDTQGHKAGDKYIKDSCKMICRVYTHSPVFRIGGDEFVVVLFGEDYENREALLEDFRNQIEENVKNESIIIVATGMAVYDPEKDDRVTSVFERADDLMYENKRNLKKKKKNNISK